MRRPLVSLLLVVTPLALAAQPPTQAQPAAARPGTLKPFAELTKDAVVHKGLFDFTRRTTSSTWPSPGSGWAGPS